MVDFYKDYVAKMFSIEGRTAIVTGATGALGGAIAAAYAMCGAKVVLTGRNKEKLEVLAGEIRDAGGEALPYAADPSVEEQVKGLVAFAAKQYGGLDILAVSHGYNKPQNILDQSVEDWQYIMDADLKSVYMIVKYAGEQMARQGRGGKMVVDCNEYHSYKNEG